MKLRDAERPDVEIDEYLWPLTGEFWPINWPALTEELQLRQRLTEIMTHVRELHLEPRLRRLGAQAAAIQTRAVTQSVIEGPVDGPAWTQTLRDPVPRALREEWTRLGERLRELVEQRGKEREPQGPLTRRR